MASHIRFRKKNRMSTSWENVSNAIGFPYTSWIALISMIIVLLCMPFYSRNRGVGLNAGIVMVSFLFRRLCCYEIFTRNQNEFTTEKVQSNKIQSSFL